MSAEVAQPEPAMAPLIVTVPRVPSFPAEPVAVGALPPTFGSALPGGPLSTTVVAEPQAASQVVSAASFASGTPAALTTAAALAAPPVTTVLHEPRVLPARVSSVVIPTGATTMRYVGTTTAQPPVTTSVAPGVVSPVLGTFGALPHAMSMAPLVNHPFMPANLGVTETMFPMVGSNPAVPTPPIGIPGGFDFKFYAHGGDTGPSLFDDQPYSYGFGHTDYYGAAEYRGGPGEPIAGEYEDPGSPPPPAPPPFMQEADRYDALAAEHERQVELLEHAPVNTQNMERQIHELLEGQRALKSELEDVKAKVTMNYRDLEVLRREAEHQAAMQPPMQPPPPYGYYDQGPPMGSPQDYHMDMQQSVISRGQDPLGVSQGSGLNTSGLGGVGGPGASGMPPGGMHPPHGAPHGSKMPPRNLGYEDTASSVLESLTKVRDHVTNHATTLHGHASRSLKSMTSQNPGGGGGSTSSAKMKLCGKTCP